jgi:molecular chaperone GrpE
LTQKKNHKNPEEGEIKVPIKEEKAGEPAGEKLPGGDGEEATPLEKVQAQLQAKTQEAAASYDQWLRLRAEFENYKKRIQKEKADHIMFGNEGLLKAIIPIIDDLERGIEQGQSLEGCGSLLDGMKLIHKHFMDTLEKFGVKSFTSRGEAFDPEKHEALYHEEGNGEPNRVVGELNRGYMFHDRLIRPAKVIVSKVKGK